MESNLGARPRFGQLQRVDLREVWPHEATDFTRWLKENLGVLNEHLEVELVSAEPEQSAGSFKVDLLAEDSDGKRVVIENQLERTNHDHLGKVITYLVSFGAERAIWIASDPRPEHVEAVKWLSDNTDVDFHLFRVEAVRIDGSPPAPLLTPIVGPSVTGRQGAAHKREVSSQQRSWLAYWTRLLDLASGRTKLYSGVNPGTSPYLGTGSGITGLSYRFCVRKHDTRIELWIDRGIDNDALNKSIFQQIEESRESIEESCPGNWTWDLMEDKRSEKIVLELDETVGWADDPDDWDAPMELLIDAMIRFEAALSPHIAALDLTD